MVGVSVDLEALLVDDDVVVEPAEGPVGLSIFPSTRPSTHPQLPSKLSHRRGHQFSAVTTIEAPSGASLVFRADR